MTDIHMNEDGFVLVTSMLILLVLTILGIAALRNTDIELQIAANDRRHKEAFYAAEAGAVVGTELVQQNVFCPDGFAQFPLNATTILDGNTVKIADLEGFIRVNEQNGNSRAFYQNETPISDSIDPLCPLCDSNLADVSFPIANLVSGHETTHLYIGGGVHMMPGGSLQMAAGYEGKGKSAAGGGVYKLYEIYSRHQGMGNSESVILLGWRQPIDMIGSCNYD